VVARQVQAPELVASATDALIALDEIETDARYGVRRKTKRASKDGTNG
jgi:hypothetical protein